MLEVVDSEPRHTILVRDHQRGYLAALDRVHDRHERAASQVHPATDLGEPLVHPQTTRETEPLHRRDLCREIVLLPRRGHPALHDRRAGTFVESRPTNFPDVRLVEVPLPGGSAAGLDPTYPLPPTHHAGRPADPLRELPNPIHIDHDNQHRAAVKKKLSSSHSSWSRLCPLNGPRRKSRPF